jgi:glycosyltransferase involved in cell wall biosynthesis
LIHAPYGVSPEFSAVGPIETSLGRYILHVGSNIPRKRVDIVLQTFAGVRRHCSDLQLVKVGPDFTSEQLAIIRERKIADFIIRRERLTRAELAALYRGAAAVLLPSDSEGFGLTVIEALACGVPVVASNLATLREAGGDAVTFAPVGELEAWIDATTRAIESCQLPRRALRLQQAARFSWANHARIIGHAYAGLLDRRGVGA